MAPATSLLPGARTARLLVGLSFALAAGCIGGSSPAGRVQEAAQDLNAATRFGRFDIALERVSEGEREQFVKRHAAWGNRVRILDYELQGMSMHTKDEAEITVSVGWQRIDEDEMRLTKLTQHWRDHRGSWQLEQEEASGGDVGLLGEAIVRQDEEPRPRAQFPTITIR